MQSLLLAGGGGLAREIAQLVRDLNQLEPRWRLAGLSAPELPARLPPDLRWLGPDAQVLADPPPDTAFAIALGSPALRRRLAPAYEQAGLRPAALVHPSARAGWDVSVGAGTLICAGVTLTTSIRIGQHVLINLHCTVGHDAEIGDFAALAPGVHLSGGVRIGAGAELGTGAVVLPGIEVGENAVVGAGAVVTRPVPPGEIWTGIPARAHRK
ncbi:MAG: acetyltransferase [Bacteroidia bacterium]|nr:acetyltransferase [Bacteroidia bacterium]